IAATLVALTWAAAATVQLNRAKQQDLASAWTPALERLWSPFLSSNLPVLMAIEDPPFVHFSGLGAYREISVNRCADRGESPRLAKIRGLLGNPEIAPSYYYAPIGEVSAAFLMGRFLGPRVPAVSLAAAHDLSWQQLANNNVLYVGASVFFNTRFEGLPVG